MSFLIKFTDNEVLLSGQLEEMSQDVSILVFEDENTLPKESIRYGYPITNVLHIQWFVFHEVRMVVYCLCVSSLYFLYLSFSLAFNEVIGFLSTFLIKMQEGEYDCEPTSKPKVFKLWRNIYTFLLNSIHLITSSMTIDNLIPSVLSWRDSGDKTLGTRLENWKLYTMSMLFSCFWILLFIFFLFLFFLMQKQQAWIFG